VGLLPILSKRARLNLPNSRCRLPSVANAKTQTNLNVKFPPIDLFRHLQRSSRQASQTSRHSPRAHECSQVRLQSITSFLMTQYPLKKHTQLNPTPPIKEFRNTLPRYNSCLEKKHIQDVTESTRLSDFWFRYRFLCGCVVCSVMVCQFEVSKSNTSLRQPVCHRKHDERRSKRTIKDCSNPIIPNLKGGRKLSLSFFYGSACVT
jgi:hypothetical protein